MDSSRIRQLADLFRATKEAHLQAFVETDGEDPAWPVWYAESMRARLNQLLVAELDTGELASLISRAEKERQAAGAPEPWPEYYARFLLDDRGKP